jgi:hypothetical protein
MIALRHLLPWVACLAVACGGASESDLFDPPPATAPGGGQTVPATGESANTPAEQATPAPAATPAPDREQAGSDGSRDPSGGSNPGPVCTAEAEPNDAVQSATGAGKTVRIALSQQDGQVVYGVLVNGMLLPYESPSEVPFVAGATYTIRVSLPVFGDAAKEASPSYQLQIRAE